MMTKLSQKPDEKSISYKISTAYWNICSYTLLLFSSLLQHLPQLPACLFLVLFFPFFLSISPSLLPCPVYSVTLTFAPAPFINCSPFLSHYTFRFSQTQTYTNLILDFAYKRKHPVFVLFNDGIKLHSVNVLHFVYLFIHWLVLFLSYCEKFINKCGLQLSLWCVHSGSSGSASRNYGIAELHSHE